MTTHILFSFLVIAVLVGSAKAVSGDERSLFRTASEVADIADLELLKLHESAGLCPWILIAYSDGCGHCRSAAPSIIRRAKETFEAADDVAHEVSIAALNCQVNTQGCHDLGVHGVPSFFLLTPDFLVAKEPTLSPITLHSPEAATGASVPQHLLRFDIGRGGGIDVHLDLARNIWGAMSNGAWNAHSRERCVDMRSFLRNSKRGDAATTAFDEANPNAAVFKEETEFHSVDVANAFFFTLYHEVALVGLDSAERRYALYRFLRAVQQRLPGLGADVLLHEMATHNSNGNPADFASFTVADWQKLVLNAGIPFQGTPRDLEWKTCKGSSWRYRGFPCGLWLLYHALSANGEANSPTLATAAVGNDDGGARTVVGDGVTAKPPDTEILFIIKNYARNFFSCEQCRNHFMRFSPNNEEDPVWQLWKVHNLVNLQLATVTDGADPQVPKRQFPGRELCPLCYRDIDIVTTNPESAVVATEIVRFLRQRYRWVPSSLHASAYTTTTLANTAGTGAGADGQGDGQNAILVHKTPMSVNMFLTMAVVVVVVLLGMQHVLRRTKAARMKKRRPILPLRMQT